MRDTLHTPTDSQFNFPLRSRTPRAMAAASSRSVAVATACVTTFFLCASPVFADTASDIRYTDLLARLGAAAPTGAGIGVGQVEANEGTNFAPDQTLTEFAGTTFVVSGASAASWHATEVAKALYGNSLSIAPGITNVWCWSASPFVTSSYLKVGSGSTVVPSTPPAGLRVFNHSWIGSFGSTTNDNDALRRLDFSIHRDQLTVVAGVNNGAGSAAQPMMAYAYHSIAVGLPNGAHSNATTPTGIDGPGRRKPDIVAPGQFTSFATPVVGAAAALLWDTADSHPNTIGNVNAARAVTVKAALLAGAQHRVGWSNGTPDSGTSKGITATPLDPLYGVDLLDINRSHLIYTGGEATGTTTPQTSTFERTAGWDYIASVASNTSVYWSFRIHQPVDEVSVVATW
ncbi:MAG: S8 family serine peptidase, partial [bacterium]